MRDSFFFLVTMWVMWIFSIVAVFVPAVRVMMRGNNSVVESWGALGRGMRRGALYITLTMLMVCTIYLVPRTLTVPLEIERSLITVLAVIACVNLAALALVMLFNRPRFLVPPSVRDQPGAIREWLSRRIE